MTTGLNPRPRRLRAAILAGGKSSRMGTDKALMTLEPGGPTLLARTIERVGQVAAEPFIVAPLDRGYERCGAPVVPDAHPGAGALGGIATGLLHIGGEDELLVVACDHPFLNVELLRRLASVDADYDALVPRTRGASRQGGDFIWQTLHAIYRPSCLPALLATLADGYANSLDFFAKISVHPIDEPELRRFDPNLRSFLSVNTSQALDLARALEREMRGDDARVGYTRMSDTCVERDANG